MTEADVPMFVARARSIVQKINELPIPTIAAIEGAALGGGLEISLSFDFRIASTTAKLGLPETKLAIIPGAGIFFNILIKLKKQPFVLIQCQTVFCAYTYDLRVSHCKNVKK